MADIRGIEDSELLRFVIGVLNADATLAALIPGGWYNEGPEAGAPVTYPFGSVFILAAAEPAYAVGPHYPYSWIVFGVRIWVREKAPTSVDAARQRTLALLHDKSGTTAGGASIHITFERAIPVRRQERDKVTYYMVGNEFKAEIDYP